MGFLKLKKWIKSKSINFALIMGSLGAITGSVISTQFNWEF